MREIRALLSLELRSLYGINKFRYTKDRKEKNRYRGLSLVWVLLIGVAFFYVGGLVYGLCFLGLADIVPAYLAVLACLLISGFGLFTAGNRIFGLKCYDILASMPIKSDAIVWSRFLAMYVEDLLLTLWIMVPGVAVYGICVKPDLIFYLTALIGTLFIPGIPLVISTLPGSLIMAVSSRMKHKSMVQAVLTVLLVVGVLAGSFSMERIAMDLDPEQLSQLAQAIETAFEQIYPPAIWLNEAMVQGSFAHLGLFAALSLTVMGLSGFTVAKHFHAIARRLQNFTAKHHYKVGSMEQRSLLKALYLREAKRYFSSGIYVTNTIIGPILGAIMSVALCFVGVDSIQNALPVEIDIAGLLPFAFAAVFSMMTTTSVSVSMEGKQFWVIKSMPIPTKALLDSKILLNLSLMLPFYLISAAAMAMAAKPNLLQLMWLMVIPAAVILFSVVFGITVNLKFHRFDWEKEEAVVKQSLSAMVGGFGGLFLSLLWGGSVLAAPIQYGNAVKAGVCLLLLAVTALLYRKNNKAELNCL